MAYLMLIAAFLANASNPAAAPAAQPTTAVPVKNDKPADKMVCRRVVPTGSIMGTRICKTQQEWDALAAGGQDMLRQTKDHQSTMGGIPLP